MCYFAIQGAIALPSFTGIILGQNTNNSRAVKTYENELKIVYIFDLNQNQLYAIEVGINEIMTKQSNYNQDWEMIICMIRVFCTYITFLGYESG